MKKLFDSALFVLLALPLLFLAALPVSAALPTKAFDISESGLWFRFDGDAEEASGALTGKLRGSPGFVEGRDGTPEGAIYFETEEQAVALQIDDIEGNWTASFWVKADAVTHHSFLCSSITGSLRVIQDDGRVGATMNGIIDRSIPYTIPLGTWTMLTFAYDEDSECTSVYVNGEFRDGMFGWQTLGLTLIGNDAPEQKGWQSAPSYALDDTWFFGRLLSDEEILSLYETNTVPPPDKSGQEEPEPEPEDMPEPAEEIEADPEAAEEEDGSGSDEPFSDPDPNDVSLDENEPRELKPGGFAAMGVILVAALFLICAGARALFGRSKQ